MACNYSPRGQAGRPLGSTSSNHAPTKINDCVAVPSTPRASNKTEQDYIDSLDVIAISDDDFISMPSLDSSSVGSALHSLAPSTDIDASTVSLGDLVRFAQDHGTLPDGTALPLFDGKSGLDAGCNISPPISEFASGSSTLPHHSNNFYASSSSSPQQLPQLSTRGARESIPSPESATNNAGESLHSRLVSIHYQLARLSESITISFNMAEDVEEIYRASRDFKSVLDSYQMDGTGCAAIPIGKCHGMTALLMLGCYSYLTEAFEFLAEKIHLWMQPSSDADMTTSATGAAPSWTQSQSPQVTLPASMIPDISVGSVRVPVSNELMVEIHKRLIHQTAHNLQASLRQCVKRMAAVQYVALDVEDGDDSWSPVAKLVELGQRELQRREDGIFMYLRQGL